MTKWLTTTKINFLIGVMIGKELYRYDKVVERKAMKLVLSITQEFIEWYFRSVETVKNSIRLLSREVSLFFNPTNALISIHHWPLMLPEPCQWPFLFFRQTVVDIFYWQCIILPTLNQTRGYFYHEKIC